LALSIRTFIASPFQIKGQSMENSYHDGEYILVDRFSYIKTEKLSEYPYDATIVDKLTKVFTVMYNNTLAHLPIYV
jgi:signal peptidase I